MEEDGKIQTGNGEYNTRIDAELVFEIGWIWWDDDKDAKMEVWLLVNNNRVNELDAHAWVNPPG